MKRLCFIDPIQLTSKKEENLVLTQTSYTHHQYIGAVSITRRGLRRFCYIHQHRSGDIDGIQNFNTKQAGTPTDSSGTNVADKTKAGLREVIICIDGVPYSTYIITSAMFEIT